MNHKTIATLVGTGIVAVTCAVSSMALADTGNGYDGTLHVPSVAVRASERPTVPTAPVTPVVASGAVVASALTCDVDWCAITIGPNGREILFYVDGPDRIGWLLQTPVTIDVRERDAS